MLTLSKSQLATTNKVINFQNSYQTLLVLWGSYSSKTILPTYTLFQTSSNYWHFQRFPSKLNYSFFRVHTILTLLECYYQTILTYWAELISNSIHTFTELGTNSRKPFFESFNGQLNRQKILKEKIPKKFEKLASHIKQIILQSTTLEFTWSLMYLWLA